ncbi:hypothetical protein CPB97_008744 [Podila verticillata]|nr:hypothetical protein CPB97_008744 [Podila verticillata]
MTATTPKHSRSITKAVPSRQQAESVDTQVRRRVGCLELRNRTATPSSCSTRLHQARRLSEDDRRPRHCPLRDARQSQTRAHGLQPWIKLPKEHMMCEPLYQELLNVKVPRASGDDEFEGQAHRTLTFPDDDTDTIQVRPKDEEAHLVIIAVEPRYEPILQHGPFVMNTKEEICSTVRDFHDGKSRFRRAANWRSCIYRK